MEALTGLINQHFPIFESKQLPDQLVIQFQLDHPELTTVYSPHLLALAYVSNDELIIPTKSIAEWSQYHTDLFPRIYPRDDLARLVIFLNNVTSQLEYAYQWTLQANQVTVEIEPEDPSYFTELQLTLPIKLRLVEGDNDFTMNDHEIYQALWLQFAPSGHEPIPAEYDLTGRMEPLAGTIDSTAYALTQYLRN